MENNNNAREYVASKCRENPRVGNIASDLGCFAGADFAVKLIESESGIATGRLRPVIGNIADPGRGHADLLANLGEFEPCFLQIPYPLRPCVHGATLRDSVDSCQRHSVTVFRCNSYMDAESVAKLRALPDTIGARVRFWRQYRKLTLDVLSKKCGLSSGAISDLEHGRQKKTGQLVDVAIHLGISPSYLRSGKGDPEEGVPTEDEILSREPWPFKLATRARIERLRPRERRAIDKIIDFHISQCEVAAGRRNTKSPTVERNIPRRVSR